MVMLDLCRLLRGTTIVRFVFVLGEYFLAFDNLIMRHDKMPVDHANSLQHWVFILSSNAELLN